MWQLLLVVSWEHYLLPTQVSLWSLCMVWFGPLHRTATRCQNQASQEERTRQMLYVFDDLVLEVVRSITSDTHYLLEQSQAFHSSSGGRNINTVPLSGTMLYIYNTYITYVAIIKRLATVPIVAMGSTLEDSFKASLDSFTPTQKLARREHHNFGCHCTIPLNSPWRFRCDACPTAFYLKCCCYIGTCFMSDTVKEGGQGALRRWTGSVAYPLKLPGSYYTWVIADVTCEVWPSTGWSQTAH